MSDAAWISLFNNLGGILAGLALLLGPSALGAILTARKLGEVSAKTDTAVALTAEGNRALEVVHKAVNSGATETRDAAKFAADRSEEIAVRLATLEAERSAAIRAFDLAKLERDEALRLKAEAAAMIADLRQQILLATVQRIGGIAPDPSQIAAAPAAPVDVVIVNSAPVKVETVPPGEPT